MPATSEKIDAYLSKHGDGWKAEILLSLRQILTSCDLEETVKWGMPVYVNNGNVVGMAAFKNHVALWFFQGVFLKDPEQILTTSDGTSKAMRQIRFEENTPLNREIITSYVHKAIDNSKAGKVLPPEKKPEVEIPEILKNALQSDEKLKAQFYGLTQNQRNEYSEHIGQAKREETAQRRLEKCKEYILKGLDLNHKYRK